MTRHSMRAFLGASALALALAAGPSMADSIFTPASDGFTGGVRAAAAEQGAPIYPGTAVTIAGQGLVPGQKITLMRGATVLNADTELTADAEGAFSFELTVDDAATPGLQPIVVIGEGPAAATVVEMKVSPQIPVSGAERFDILSEPVTRGLYQVAYSPAADALFVAAAVGRPPVSESAVVKVNAETLETLASVAPGAAPARPDGSDGGLFAAYGVGVDDANGNVWITNTRQNTIAVYSQADLSLVKQFEPGAVTHSRDVVIDSTRNRAYASTSFTGEIAVFDTQTLEQLDSIQIASQIRGEDFGAMSLELHPEAGKLITVSLNTPEAAVIDLNTNEVKVLPLTAAQSASGASYDPQEGLIFVVSQGTDNLLIVKEESGEVLHDVDVGAGPLNVAFEPVSRLAFVANRGSGTITVVNTEGEIVANLDAGTFPNQLRADGKGNVFAVNKSRGEDDPNGDRIWRIKAAE